MTLWMFVDKHFEEGCMVVLAVVLWAPLALWVWRRP
jgi:hypothetical protein